VGGSRRDAGLEPRACAREGCGQTFQPYRNSQVACSRSCRDQLPGKAAVRQEYEASEQRRSLNAALRRKPEQLERARINNLRHRLAQAGLSLEQYEAKVAAQGNRCIICGAEPDPDGKHSAARLHADHDHVTMLSRDLLCLNCNVGIGHFGDDPELLRAAAEYIERHRAAAAAV
jgi:hypothetical protein